MAIKGFRWQKSGGASLCLLVLTAAVPPARLAAEEKTEAQISPATPPAPLPRPKTNQNRRLSDISLEELMNIEVSSVSRKDQKLSQTAAAAFVITQEDIRRSGATSVPEALRMVPGLQVAQIDGNKWAISARGFASRFANKMLVLIDGRSVYNILYSGVYWEQNDVMVEDIERIEVIRGPGATMWGANAVNGVINIITRNSKDTQGNLISTSAGTIDRPSVSVRHGGRAGNRATYRAWARYFDRAGMADQSGGRAWDGWTNLRAGARVDFEINARDSFSAQGDVFRGSGQQSIFTTFPLIGLAPPVRGDMRQAGGFGLVRWQRVLSPRSSMTLQSYVDATDFRENFGAATLRTADVDFQHRTELSGRHEVVWGGGYRYSYSSVSQNTGFTFDPPRSNDHLTSAFLQDNISLVPEKLVFTIGSKFQHNTFTGFEVQPSARLIYLATPQQSLWTAVSRAVRTPSRADHHLRLEYALPGAPPGTIGRIAGDPALGSENVLSYEAGYRNQLTRRFSFDLAAFYSVYDHLKEMRMGAPYFETGPVRRLVVPSSFSHSLGGRSYGAELATTFTPTSRWRWNANYSWIRLRMNPKAQGLLSVSNFDRAAPQHQVQLRSSIDLTRKVSFDTSLYYVSALQGLGIPAYARVDARLAWRLSEQFELSFLGQNLLDDRHPEFRPEDYVLASQIRRAFLIRLLWTF